MKSRTKVLVIGCGIAGAAVSMFLQRAGIEAHVFETQFSPDDGAGAFLNLMPNGLRVLEILGLREDVAQAGHATDSFTFINEKGRRLGALDLKTAPTPGGAKSVLIKRGLLNKILRASAEASGIQVSFGKRLVDLQACSNGAVTARFEDGTEVKGSAIIGCDGVHSQTRRLLLPYSPGPAYNGLMNTGSIIESSPIPASSTMTMTFGRKGFFGYQAVETGEVYWFSNFPAKGDSIRGAGESTLKDRLLSMHASSPHPIPEIIRSIDGAVGVWPTYELESLPSWHSDSVCLAGDAAHAASPSAGSGASLALEDALVLAKSIRDEPSLSEAFARYEARRKPRTDWVVRQARRNDRQKLMTNPLAVRLRDGLMPFFFKLGDRAMSRIYAYEVDW